MHFEVAVSMEDVRTSENELTIKIAKSKGNSRDVYTWKNRWTIENVKMAQLRMSEKIKVEYEGG